MIAEYHLHLDDNECLTTFYETNDAIRHGDDKMVVHSTQVIFLSFSNANRLFVHYSGLVYEITLNDCVGTNREIRENHCIYKLLLNGEFDWFRGY